MSGPLTRRQPPDVRALLDALGVADAEGRHVPTFRTMRNGTLSFHTGDRVAPILTVRCGHCLGVYEDAVDALSPCPWCHRFARGAA